MNLHIELTKTLKPYFKDRFVLAISGGLDSMALFHLFLHFRKNFNVNFSVMHFHHGPSSDKDLQNFRFKIHALVQSECEKARVKFFSNFSGSDESAFLRSFGEELKSESQLREKRYDFFNQTLVDLGSKWMVLAHHKEDQLETRVLRLLRGTGPGGLKAMELVCGNRLRPLLPFSKKQLQDYLASVSGAWLDDPSNQSLDPLRNWVRQFWLPSLESKFPGASASLNRSIENLVSSLDQSEEITSLGSGQDLSISELLPLSEPQKKQVLATYMRGQGLKNYGVSHINEILKRLDTEEKSHTFRLLGRCWKVDAGRMSLGEPT